VFKIKDKKAFIFYFLMSIIFLDLGNGIRRLSYVPKIQDMFDNSIISIMHIYNTGGAFSILQNQTNFLIALSIFALIFIAWHVYKEVDYSESGRVVDYFKLNCFNFPIFNAFDIMICLGILIYTVFVLFELKIPPVKKDLDEKDCNN